ncbi:MAG TPA: YdcF family protein [Acidimicrobiales bacterium]|nr:YdcF family protein [Acidimicrobiales bacterium]
MLLAPFRWAVRIVVLVLAVVVGYFAVTLVQVWLTGRHYDPHPAGAILVMGAAQYDCVPSPDLRARLDQAATLYHQGDAHLIMVTGSKEPGDKCTEAQSGARYLEEVKGVPASAILEAGGDDSWQNIADATPVLDTHHATVVLVTTDPFHEDRSMAIASDMGLRPSPTPTQASPITGWASVPYYLKEALGVGLGRIIGFNHLEWLHQT